MANPSNTQISGLLPVDLAALTIVELAQVYDGALAADLGLQSVLSQPNTDINSAAGDWLSQQADSLTFLCQAVRDEMLRRDVPECATEAAMRREVVLGYALRCGDEANHLISLVVLLSERQKLAA